MPAHTRAIGPEAQRPRLAPCRAARSPHDVQADEDTAAEDAHEHAWPGRRDLPIVPRQPETQKARPRWVETVTDADPAGWLESGGPIRTIRAQSGTRHVSNHTGCGGYDLYGANADTSGRERAW